MRLSMSGRIFGVIILLLALALGVMGLGLYSINRLGGEANDLGRRSGRAVTLSLMNRVVLERDIALTDLLRTNDAAAKRDILEKRMAGELGEMDAILAQYATYFAPEEAAVLAERGGEIRKRWQAYVDAGVEAATVSLINSNVEADKLSIALIPFWGGIFQAVDALSADILAADAPDAVRWALEAKGLSGKLASYRLETMRYNLNTNAANMKTVEDRMIATKDDIIATLSAISRALPADKGGSAAEAILTEVRGQIEPVLRQIIPIINANSNARAADLYAGPVQEAQERLETYTTERINAAVQEMTLAIEHVNSLGTTVFRMMIIGSAAGIVVCVILAWWVIRSITRRLTEVIDALGDSASQVNLAAGQISGSSKALAEGATEQAASLEETSSALEEMASMTRQNADNATRTNATTQNNNKLIAHGSESVKNMSVAMTEIDESAEQISRIIKTIEDIAFQTNLLALNAAVEAARAGEAGKGFAVVADEVRNLASRSAQAAQETTQLIERTIARVKNGAEIARELDSGFQEIEVGSRTVSANIDEITSATNEQAQGVDQLNNAMAQMDKVTQQNAAASEESASAATELSSQAAVLNTMVENLVGIVQGGGKAGRPKPKPGSAKRLTGGGPNRKGKGGGLRVVNSSEVIPFDDM